MDQLQQSMLALSMTLLIATRIFVAAQAQAPEQTQWLAAHNVARRAEGAGLPPLTWNTSAYEFALAWAQQQAAIPGCAFEHTGDEDPYGENIAWKTSVATATPANVVNGWMSEKPLWNFASATCTAGENECGHYTQVVWKATTSVGCASVLVPEWNCEDVVGGEFFICNYYPPGNFPNTNPY